MVGKVREVGRGVWRVRLVRVVGLCVGFGFITPSDGAAQSRADSLAVRDAALDYVEGWFTADADRMRRALHPDLVKQMPLEDGSFHNQSADELVEMTKLAGGADRDWSDAVEILGMHAEAAAVRVDVPEWVDFLHLVKTDGRWRIIHVLWDLRQQVPEEAHPYEAPR